MEKPTKSFNDLLSECCWLVIEGITSGEKLRSSMYNVVKLAREWEPPEKEDSVANEVRMLDADISRCPADMELMDRMKWITKSYNQLKKREG